ncbi:MAG: hypothetical protein OXI24_00805, partial [Candidatus Poribacteria bacterium]|nr:hypothetical protein [Candidatus Poribacteria bacterium]
QWTRYTALPMSPGRCAQAGLIAKKPNTFTVGSRHLITPHSYLDDSLSAITRYISSSIVPSRA